METTPTSTFNMRQMLAPIRCYPKIARTVRSEERKCACVLLSLKLVGVTLCCIDDVRDCYLSIGTTTATMFEYACNLARILNVFVHLKKSSEYAGGPAA